MESYLYASLAVATTSLISLVGAFTLSLKERFLQKYLFVLVSLAVGALLGDAFIHLIPEAFADSAQSQSVALILISGILFFFILEKFLHWHHHENNCADCETKSPVSKLILVSDGVHNLLDGILIGASFLVSTEIGVSTTLAIILHEIPQEIGDFGVLIHAGYSRTRALFWNFISGLFAFVGLGLAFTLGSWSTELASTLLPFAAGGFIYIALSDLIPELHKTKSPAHSLLQLASIAVGVGAMILLLNLE